MRSFIKKHPVAGFIILAFAISYLLGVPLKIFILNQVFKNNEVALEYLSKTFIVYGPAIAAIIITSILSGKQGVNNLLAKLKPDPRYLAWWVTLPVAAFAIFVLSLLLAGVSLNAVVNTISMHYGMLIIHFAAAVIIIGVGEEMGWRGWLLPQLTKKKRLITATLLVAVTWCLWHLPKLLSGYQVGIPFIIICFSTAVIFTWIWLKVKGNIFVLAMVHGAIDAVEAFFEYNMKAFSVDIILHAWMILSLIYLAIAMLVLFMTWKKWFTILPVDEQLSQ